jgi:hypothetical protein
MYLFRNGGVLARTVGAMTAGAIVRWARATAVRSTNSDRRAHR